jgi:hypothetical protein
MENQSSPESGTASGSGRTSPSPRPRTASGVGRATPSSVLGRASGLGTISPSPGPGTALDSGRINLPLHQGQLQVQVGPTPPVDQRQVQVYIFSVATQCVHNLFYGHNPTEYLQGRQLQPIQRDHKLRKCNARGLWLLLLHC